MPSELPAHSDQPTHLLHLPDIHCGGCIATVEAALHAVPGVLSARVNLTLKRVSVRAPGLATAPLIDAVAAAGHRADRLDATRLGPADKASSDLLIRIGVSGFAMMNVMLLSVAVWSGATGATAQVFHLVSAAIAVPAVVYAAQPFFVSALAALGKKRLNMDVPISLAIILASVASLASAFGFSERAGWFDAALALTFFLLVGRFLESRGRAAARSAAAELAALEAPQARKLVGQTETIVSADALVAGDLIRLRPGNRMPADGVIIEGRTDLDRSVLTGESRPEPAAPGDPVTAGETSLSGALTVRVDRAGRDTALARIAEIVASAETQRSRYTGIADRAARFYAPVAHLLGLATFIGWFAATGDGWLALDIAISVLVITCPCALGLAVPAVATVVTSRLFRRGILVKSSTALERLAEINEIAFDKTGTLTTGQPRVTGDIAPGPLALAAGLAAGSSHPLSRALVFAAKERGIPEIPVNDIREYPGRGIEGRHGNARVRLGQADWIGAQGDATTWLAVDWQPPVPIHLSETLDPAARATVAALRAMTYPVALLSGDAAAPVNRIAADLGLTTAASRLSPQDKIAWVTDQAAQGRRVLMVGDGLNDTGALAAAHASIAPGSALDAARSAADLVLLSGGLAGVPHAIDAARVAMVRMRQNIGLALAYNVVAVPIAVLGHATPFLAALAMSGSSLVVTLNAVRK